MDTRKLYITSTLCALFLVFTLTSGVYGVNEQEKHNSSILGVYVVLNWVLNYLLIGITIVCFSIASFELFLDSVKKEGNAEPCPCQGEV